MDKFFFCLAPKSSLLLIAIVTLNAANAQDSSNPAQLLASPAAANSMDSCIGAKLSLEVSKTKINFGEQITIEWNSNLPEPCKFGGVLLNETPDLKLHLRMEPNGSITVQPKATRKYNIVLLVIDQNGVQSILTDQASVYVAFGNNVTIGCSELECKMQFLQAVSDPCEFSNQLTLDPPDRLERIDEPNASLFDSGIGVANPAGWPLGSFFKRGAMIVPPLKWNGNENRFCRTVSISAGEMFEFSGTESSFISVAKGIHINGERSSVGGGPIIRMKSSPGDSAQTLISVNGDNVRIEGLTIIGPNIGEDPDVDIASTAIYIDSKKGVEIVRSEISNFDHGVSIADNGKTQSLPDPFNALIAENYIHDNLRSHGYGVLLQRYAYALISRNVFDNNRHSIASDGRPHTGYVARENLILKGGSPYEDIPFDVHGQCHCGDENARNWQCGLAGEYTEIAQNSFQFNPDKKNRPVFSIRGDPSLAAIFIDNVVEDDELIGKNEAVWDREKGSFKRCPRADKSVEFLTALPDFPVTYLGENKTGVKTFGEYDVCDFNGDGRDDLFLATGATWWWSSAGKAPWRYLNSSRYELAELLLADFDGDGKCDVITPNNSWRFWRSGTEASIVLNEPSMEKSELRIGNFDGHKGDPATDVFRIDDGQWMYYSLNDRKWRPLARSKKDLEDLLFGDFDGDGSTDVFSVVNDGWSISSNGSGKWTRLNDILSTRLHRFVIVNITGSRKDDIVEVNALGRPVRVSEDGSSSWQPLDYDNSPDKEKGCNNLRYYYFGAFDNRQGTEVFAINPNSRRACIVSGANEGAFVSYGDFHF